MTVNTNHHDRLLFWVAFAVLMVGIALGDAAIIAWNAKVAGFWELLVSLFSFVLISAGVLFTIWEMKSRI